MMKRIGFLVALAMTLAAYTGDAGAQSGPDPVALTRAGQVQCYAPDPQAKTCASMATYVPDARGQVINIARVMLAPSPLVVLTTRAPVTVDNGTICGTIAAADIAAGQLTIDNIPATPERASAIKARLTTSLAPVIGKRICTRYTPDGDGLRAHEIVEGTPENPSADQRVTWVNAAEGYRVGQ